MNERTEPTNKWNEWMEQTDGTNQWNERTSERTDEAPKCSKTNIIKSQKDGTGTKFVLSSTFHTGATF